MYGTQVTHHHSKIWQQFHIGNWKRCLEIVFSRARVAKIPNNEIRNRNSKCSDFFNFSCKPKKWQHVFILNKGADFQNQIIGNNSTKRGWFTDIMHANKKLVCPFCKRITDTKGDLRRPMTNDDHSHPIHPSHSPIQKPTKWTKRASGDNRAIANEVRWIEMN